MRELLADAVDRREELNGRYKSVEMVSFETQDRRRDSAAGQRHHEASLPAIDGSACAHVDYVSEDV